MPCASGSPGHGAGQIAQFLLRFARPAEPIGEQRELRLDAQLFGRLIPFHISAQFLEDFFRLREATEREQRLAALAQQLAPIVGRRHIASEGENVLGMTFLPAIVTR